MNTSTINPLAPVGRTWRRLRRRPRAMQIRTVLMILAVVVGLVLWIVMAPSGAPGSAQGLQLTVADIGAARAELAGRGAEMSEVFHDAGGVFHHAGTSGRVTGPAPAHQSYGSFASVWYRDGRR